MSGRIAPQQTMGKSLLLRLECPPLQALLALLSFRVGSNLTLMLPTRQEESMLSIQVDKVLAGRTFL